MNTRQGPFCALGQNSVTSSVYRIALRLHHIWAIDPQFDGA
jgi:hypothetical protein